MIIQLVQGKVAPRLSVPELACPSKFCWITIHVVIVNGLLSVRNADI